MSTGLVLVWDLDQTLIATPYIQGVFNQNAIDVMFKCIKAKANGSVSANLLLTNNQSISFILSVVKDLISLYNSKNPANKIEYLFDNIYTGQKRIDNILLEYVFVNSKRKWDQTIKRGSLTKEIVYLGNIRKGLEDVKNMLDEVKIPSDNLENRVFFFDDIPYHKMIEELPKDHYIVISPPFGSGLPDITDYSVINGILDSELEKISLSNLQSAGSRKIKSKRKNKRKSRKIRRLSKYFSLHTI